MTTHTQLFNKLAGTYDFATLWQIEDAVSRDLRQAEIELETAELAYKYAPRGFKSQAYVNWTLAKINCQEKKAAYNKFYC